MAGFYYVVGNLCGLATPLTDKSPDSTVGALVDILVAVWSLSIAGCFIGLVGNMTFIGVLSSYCNNGTCMLSASYVDGVRTQIDANLTKPFRWRGHPRPRRSPKGKPRHGPPQGCLRKGTYMYVPSLYITDSNHLTLRCLYSSFAYQGAMNFGELRAFFRERQYGDDEGFCPLTA